MPFMTKSTRLSSWSREPMCSAIVGRAGALTATMTMSCGCRSPGRSVATGRETSIPSRVSTRSPSCLIAASCSPRAISETSVSPAASRPAMWPPTAPAPYTQILMCGPGSVTCRSVELPALLCCGGAEERDVVAGRDVIGTELLVTTDEIRPPTQSADADGLPVLSAGLDDVAVCRIDLRVVHLPRDPQLYAEVVRTHEEHAHAVHCGDGVRSVQPAPGLDHGDHHGCLVEFIDDLTGGERRVVQLGRCARQRSLPQGRVFH